MARRRHLLAIAFLVVTCGGRVTTTTNPDTGGGTSPATGGTQAIAGTSGVGGASGVACGNVECPPGTACCSPSCGLCVGPGDPCPAIACATPVPGPPGAAGSTNGAGGSVISGGGGSSGYTSLAQCHADLFSFCEEGLGICLCDNCFQEISACSADPGCQAIFYCAVLNNCINAADCASPSKCGALMSAHAASLPLALKVSSCSGSPTTMDGGFLGPACLRDCRLPSMLLDAGATCAAPPAKGAPRCNRIGSTGDLACGFSCNDDGNNTYQAKCDGATRTCSCFYNGKSTCACSWQIAPGCRSCCPPWIPGPQ